MRRSFFKLSLYPDVTGSHYLQGWPELPREHVAWPGVELLGGLTALRRVRRLGQLVEGLVQVPRSFEACLRKAIPGLNLVPFTKNMYSTAIL